MKAQESAPLADDDAPLFAGMPSTHTHGDLVNIAVRWLRNSRGCAVAFGEIVTSARVNPDAIGFASHGGARVRSILVECKTSRADFRADRLKLIHRHPDSCPGQERWYLTPPGLVRVDELPAGWGLAEVGKSRVRVVREAARPETSAARASEDMRILVSALRRHECGSRWDALRGRFETFVAREAREGGR